MPFCLQSIAIISSFFLLKSTESTNFDCFSLFIFSHILLSTLISNHFFPDSNQFQIDLIFISIQRF